MLIADWIKNSENLGKFAPRLKKFSSACDIVNATLKISARGVYVAELNGNRVGNLIMHQSDHVRFANPVS